MRRGALLVLVLGAVLAAPGCVLYRGPRGVEEAIEDQMGVRLDREFGLKLGFIATKTVSGIAKAVDDEGVLDDVSLSSIGVATFSVEGTPERPANLDPERLGLRGYETVLRARDDGDDVLLVVKAGKKSIREAVLVVCDGEEVVISRFKGDLDGLIRSAMAKQARLSHVEVDVKVQPIPEAED